MRYKIIPSLIWDVSSTRRAAIMPLHIRFIRRLTDLALVRKPYALLSSTPCELAYIKPCQCWQFQQYVDLNARDPTGEVRKIKGSLDVLMPDGILLEDDELELGEVEVSREGVIDPENACGFVLSSIEKFANIFSPSTPRMV